MSLPAPAMRPTFTHDLPHPPREVVAALSTLLERYPGRLVGPHLVLTVPDADRHFWSPHLTIEIEPRDDGRASHLHARFSPHPNVWTAIGFTYLSLIVTGFFALMWAGAQLTLGNAPHALWVTLGCGVCVAGLWWISLVGQRLAYDQIFALRRSVEATIETAGMAEASASKLQTTSPPADPTDG